MMGLRREDMNHNYEYEYHDLAEDADFIEEVDTDDIYYDDGTDEPWIDEQDENVLGYDAYYHDIADEIED